MSEDSNRDHSDIPELPRPWGQPRDPEEDTGERPPTIPVGSAQPDLGESPTDPPPPLTSVPATVTVAPPANGKGCGKPAAIGCGCLTLAVGLLLIVGIAMSGRIVSWFLTISETTIVEGMPAGVSDDDQQLLAEAFAQFRVALESGDLRTQGVTRLQVELTNAFSRAQNGVLEPVDIERLLDAFRAVLPQLGEVPYDPPPDLERGPRSVPIAMLLSATTNACGPALG